jgi:formylglycine-generating enzyme required for sulfatase activity
VSSSDEGAPAVVAAEYAPGAPPAITGEIDFRTEVASTISVDGVEIFRLPKDGGRVIPIATGRHVVSAVAAETGTRWEKPINVLSGQRATAIVEFPPPTPAGYRAAESFTVSDPRIEFVPVRAGEFVMGFEGRHQNEQPAHRVRLTKPFELGRYELTQEQWSAVMGPIELDQSGDIWSAKKLRIRLLDIGDKKPVVGVSWEDVQEFLTKLNSLDQRHVYRLPTEAEWEYACRAGTDVDLPSDILEMAWVKDNFGLEMHPVGKKRPNAWGIFDMQGNAEEWVNDWYDKDYYRRTPAEDPKGPATGTTRVLRGGDAWNPTSNCRCAYRQGDLGQPIARRASTGFRVVREER